MSLIVEADRDVIRVRPAATARMFLTLWLISPARSSCPSSACLRPVTSRKIPNIIRSTIPASAPWPRAEIQRTSCPSTMRKSISYGPATDRVPRNAARTRSRSAGWMWADKVSNSTSRVQGRPHSSNALSSIVKRLVSTFQDQSATHAASMASRRCSRRHRGAGCSWTDM